MRNLKGNSRTLQFDIANNLPGHIGSILNKSLKWDGELCSFSEYLEFLIRTVKDITLMFQESDKDIPRHACKILQMVYELRDDEDVSEEYIKALEHKKEHLTNQLISLDDSFYEQHIGTPSLAYSTNFSEKLRVKPFPENVKLANIKATIEQVITCCNNDESQSSSEQPHHDKISKQSQCPD